jgi:hypothetical protein
MGILVDGSSFASGGMAQFVLVGLQIIISIT